jgi:hypothetical protein
MVTWRCWKLPASPTHSAYHSATGSQLVRAGVLAGDVA